MQAIVQTSDSITRALPDQNGFLPPDDVHRMVLHNEVHARPPARIRLPALITYVAVLNQGVTREQEGDHLSQLPGQARLVPEAMLGNFLRLRLDGIGCTMV